MVAGCGKLFGVGIATGTDEGLDAFRTAGGGLGHLGSIVVVAGCGKLFGIAIAAGAGEGLCAFCTAGGGFGYLGIAVGVDGLGCVGLVIVLGLADSFVGGIGFVVFSCGLGDDIVKGGFGYDYRNVGGFGR